MGCVMLLAFWAGVWVGAVLLLAVAPLRELRQERAMRRQVLNGGPVSSESQLAALGDGPVVLEGRMPSQQPDPVGGAPDLAVFHRHSFGNNNPQLGGSGWRLDEVHTPEFSLALSDGSATISNGCRHRGEVLFVFTVAGLAKTFLIGEKCYSLGGTTTVLYTDDGFHRYTGFRTGEKVSAVGNVQNGRMTADAIFAGSAQEYAKSLRSNVWPVVISVAIGAVLGLGPIVWLAVGSISSTNWALRRRRRRTPLADAASPVRRRSTG